MRLFRISPTLLVIGTLAVAAPSATAFAQANDHMQSASPTTKHGKLRQLQIINRAYQVSFGRSLRPNEAKKLATATKAQIVQQMMDSPELAKMYAQRLAAYASNRTDPSGSMDVRVSTTIKNLAKPSEKLDDVLKKLTARRHKGSTCGEGKNATCFAEWLVGRVAPSLGQAWVDQRASELGGWTYARLLEQITLSSL